MMIRPSRRRLALALGTLALVAPGLVGCGFSQSTNRPYTPAAGANYQDSDVDVLGAVVVSATPGSGTFVASLSNNSTEPTTFDTLASVTADELTAEEFTPKEINGGGLLNLATDGGVPLTGDFEAGDSIAVRLAFASGELVTMEVPVVTDDGDFAGLDISTTAVPTEPPSPEATAEATDETSE